MNGGGGSWMKIKEWIVFEWKDAAKSNTMDDTVASLSFADNELLYHIY